MSQIILHAEGMSIKLLDFEYLISKKADDNGYPYGGGALKYVIAGVEATKDITFFITAQGMEQSHSTTIYSTPFRKTFESKGNAND